jgi:hypothetical protein
MLTIYMKSLLLLASFESAMSQCMRYMALLAFAVAFIMVIAAGWQFRSGSPDQAKSTLLGAVVIALAGVITQALFGAGGLPTVSIGR